MCFVDFFGCLEVLRIFFLGERCFFAIQLVLKFNSYFWYSEHPCFQEEGITWDAGFPSQDSGHRLIYHWEGFRIPTTVSRYLQDHHPRLQLLHTFGLRRVPIFRRSVLLVDLGVKYGH